MKDIPDISDIRLFRKLGEYDQSLGYLRAILADDDTPEYILRQAYNELVTIMYLTEGNESAETVAREALTKFPDLKADSYHYPTDIQVMYRELRKIMFGRLMLYSYPDQCTVHLDDREIGYTPLDSIYVLVGEHTLRLSKFGYEDIFLDVIIEPDSEIERFATMQLYRQISKVGFGLELGLSSASLKYSGGMDGQFAGVGRIRSQESIPRISAGAFIHFRRNEKVVFQLGVLYINHGNRASYDMYVGHKSGQYDAIHKYVALSSLLKYYLSLENRIIFCAGLEFGYLLDAKLSIIGGGTSIDIMDRLQRRQISLVIGAGYEIGIGKHFINFSIKHTRGLLSTRKYTLWDDVDYKPIEWMIAVGLIFNG